MPVSPWRILTLAVTAQFGISVIDQGIPTLTGFIKSDLGLSATTAGLVVSSFAFGKVFGSYAAGRAADRIGERRVLIGGGLATAALVALAAQSPLPALVVLLMLAGATRDAWRAELVSFETPTYFSMLCAAFEPP